MVYLINCVTTLAFVGVLHTTFQHKLCAYLDPGTGSLILQMIIAGLCGGLFA